jgi:hypothetical protein
MARRSRDLQYILSLHPSPLTPIWSVCILLRARATDKALAEALEAIASSGLSISSHDPALFSDTELFLIWVLHYYSKRTDKHSAITRNQAIWSVRGGRGNSALLLPLVIIHLIPD